MTVVSGQNSPDEIIISNGNEYTSRRRTATKNVSYNEKEADIALARKIKQLEKANSSKQKSEKGETIKKNGIQKKANNGKKSQKSSFKYQSFLQDKNTPWNFIPSLPNSFKKYARFSTMLDIDEMTVDVSKQLLLSDGSAVLKKDEHIFMVSEPPGEPYYIGRIVEFVPKKEFRSLISRSLHLATSFPAIYFQLKMNWYYRPRDIQERTNSTSSRMLYASLHNDVCPIYSFRGKCNVKFQKEFTSIDQLTEYVSRPNCFYFNQLFDRYTLKYYQMERTDQMAVRVASDLPYFKILTSKFPFIFYEDKFPLDNLLTKYVCGKRTEDQSWDLRCGECRDWCHQSSSIKCDDCKILIHLWCMDPPLEKKPAKGVVWICSNCVGKQNNQEHITRDKEWEGIESSVERLTESLASIRDFNTNRENWWFQYLGEDMCNHLGDPLFDDYIAPFPWKKSRVSLQKGQWSNCNQQWVEDPYSNKPGERGTSASVEGLWIVNNEKMAESELDEYVKRCKSTIPGNLEVQPEACNFIDIILKLLMQNDYNSEISFLKATEIITRESLKEPTLSQEEIKKFEEGVSLYGSELHPVCKHVGTQSMSMIVRYYYYWKKTPNGRRIWGNFKGRAKNRKKQSIDDSTNKKSSSDKGDKNSKRIPKKKAQSTQLLKHIDDSSFDSEQISDVKKCFQCMFCSLDYSPLWYRVTGGSEDDHIHRRLTTGVNEKVSGSDSEKAKQVEKDNEKLNALCIRCARMWRRYGIRWSSPIDVLRQLYGSSSSSVQGAIKDLLEDNDEQAICCSTNQAFSKNLDWELVIDTESITKQRYAATDNPEKLLKMKRNTLSSQAQMNKSVKKLIDLNSIKPVNLEESLMGYISRIEAQIKRREEIKFKRQKERALQEQLISEAHMKKSSKSAITTKQAQVLVTESKPQITEIQVKQQIVPYASPSVIRKLMPNGEFSINIEFETPTVAPNASITVNPDFSMVKLSDPIISILRQDREKHMLTEDISSESKRKRKKPSTTSLDKSSGFVINKSYIPVVKPFQSLRSEILQMYNRISPNYRHNVVSRKNAKKNPMQKASESSTMRDSSQKRNNTWSQTFSDPNENTLVNETRNFCRVCFSDYRSKTTNELSCSNCGMKVHASCYGIKCTNQYHASLKGKLWLCDPCSNDRNPVVSTNYQCVLCSTRDIHNESAKKVTARSLPNALKCTADGSWCHILCAIYRSMTKFASIETLQPIIGTECSLLNRNNINCNVCNLSGGLLVKCQSCDDQFHPSCGADKEGFFFGFRKQVKSNVTNNSEISFVEDQKDYTASPVILCPKHIRSPELVPFHYRVRDSDISLMKLFIREQKFDPQFETLSTIQLRIHAREQLRKMLSVSMDYSVSKESKITNGVSNVQIPVHGSCSRNELLSAVAVNNGMLMIPEVDKEELVEYPVDPPRDRSSRLLASTGTSFTAFGSEKCNAKIAQQKATKRIRNKNINEPDSQQVKLEEGAVPMAPIVVQIPPKINNIERTILPEKL